MSDANPTLADFLPDEIEGLGEQIKAHVAEAKGAVAWPVVESQAMSGLKSSLAGFDVFGLLGQAWAKVRELRALKEPGKQAPGEIGIVPVGQHQTTFTAEPALHLTIAGWAAPPLKFGLVTNAIFESVHLSVRDGHLVAAAPGKVAFTTALSLGSIPLHTPKELGHVKLPGQIKFEPGWRIP
jgi:hypothetical protein